MSNSLSLCRVVCLLCVLLFASLPPAVSADAMRQFIAGNIADKTRAVTSAAGGEAYELSRAAFSFVIAYKNVLTSGNDAILSKDLSALAVAAVLQLNTVNVPPLDDEHKSSLVDDICAIFTLFPDDDTVHSAILNRMAALKDDLPLKKFVECLNSKVEKAEEATSDEIDAFRDIGNERSFAVLYAFSDAGDTQADDALINLLCRVPNALYVALDIIKQGNAADASYILSLVDTSPMSPYLVAPEVKGTIAEAVLKKAAWLPSIPAESKGDMEGFPSNELICHSLAILKSTRWTRASSTVYEVLSQSTSEWLLNADNGQSANIQGKDESLNAADVLCQIIDAAVILSPIDSPHLISSLLTNEVLRFADGSASNKVMSASIKALGDIGDKSAFDALITVTNTPGIDNQIKSSANTALSRLKW